MSLIPKKIFQSWKTKNLPKNIAENSQKIRELNPEYEYYLFDDNDCREFILKHFGINYANAFDELIPGAFKCDFWRYTVMYIIGGVYIDADMTPLVPFREMFTDQDEFVSIIDRVVGGIPGIFQSFLACRPGHPIMRDSMELSFYNIVSKRSNLLGLNTLSITGPGVVAIAVNLFLNKKNTSETITPGKYNNLLLFTVDRSNSYTYSIQGEKIFKNKFNGYKPITNYGIVEMFRHNPLKRIHHIIYAIVFVFLLIIIIIIYKTRKSLSNCRQSCKV